METCDAKILGQVFCAASWRYLRQDCCAVQSVPGLPPSHRRKRRHRLQCIARCRRLCGHVEMTHSSPFVTEHDKDVQNTEDRGRNREEVARSDSWHVIVQKRPPGPRRWLSYPDHVLGHSLLGHIMAQQGQFGYDPQRAPNRVHPGHAANQVRDFAFHRRASGWTFSRCPAPIAFESLAMTVDDRFRLNDDERRSPVRPESRQAHPDGRIAWMQLRPFA